METENETIALAREMRELNSEKNIQNIVLNAEKEKYANLLRSEMGQDIKDVLSGKKVVKMSKWEIFKYKFNYYLNKIFKVL